MVLLRASVTVPSLAPAAAATVLDGYELARKGEAGKALSISAIASSSPETFIIPTTGPKLSSIITRME